MNREKSKPDVDPSVKQMEEPSSEEQLEAISKTQPGATTPWSPRDLLISYILLAVSMQRAHGYLIEEYLKSLGFFHVEMSTLYRTLRQLEKDGLLLSAWEPGPTGPARRVYTLTDAGRLWLDNWRFTLELYRNMIDQFFYLYTGNQLSQKSGDATQPDEENEPR
jgi:PadR family transcriptional regulator PadR